MFGRQFPKAAAQTLLRLVRDRNDTPRLPLAPPRQGDTDARAMLVMPRRFDQQPPHQCVPGARDAAAAMFLTGGVLAGHESEIRHQRAGRLEPTKVVQLRQDQNGRQGVDAPEAAQPPDRLS